MYGYRGTERSRTRRRPPACCSGWRRSSAGVELFPAARQGAIARRPAPERSARAGSPARGRPPPRSAGPRPCSRGSGSSGPLTGRPRLKSERLDAPQLSRVRDLLGEALDDHAPADPADRVDPVDLECRPYRAQQGEQLGPGPGADQYRLRRFVEHVVDGPYHRLWPMGRVTAIRPTVPSESSRRHSARSSSSISVAVRGSAATEAFSGCELAVSFTRPAYAPQCRGSVVQTRRSATRVRARRRARLRCSPVTRDYVAGTAE